MKLKLLELQDSSAVFCISIKVGSSLYVADMHEESEDSVKCTTVSKAGSMNNTSFRLSVMQCVFHCVYTICEFHV
jgi:hypothetical protein